MGFLLVLSAGVAAVGARNISSLRCKSVRRRFSVSLTGGRRVRPPSLTQDSVLVRTCRISRGDSLTPLHLSSRRNEPFSKLGRKCFAVQSTSVKLKAAESQFEFRVDSNCFFPRPRTARTDHDRGVRWLIDVIVFTSSMPLGDWLPSLSPVRSGKLSKRPAKATGCRFNAAKVTKMSKNVFDFDIVGRYKQAPQNYTKQRL